MSFSRHNVSFKNCKYSRLSFSRPRLSRITAYLEVKIRSLFKHENLTTGNKVLWKRGGAISPLFHNIFNTFPTSGLKLYIHLYKIWLFDLVFLNSANLICRSTDISKYVRESFGIRDNESRLYMLVSSNENTMARQNYYWEKYFTWSWYINISVKKTSYLHSIVSH